MNDMLSIQWELQRLQKEGRYDGESVLKSVEISKEQGFLGFAVKADQFPFKAHFKSQYLDQLRKMKSNGELEQIVDSFLAR